jgi:hypothetical protein
MNSQFGVIADELSPNRAAEKAFDCGIWVECCTETFGDRSR